MVRMAFVQLVIGEDLAELGRDQRAVILAKVPARAPIYDRNMRILTGEFASRAVVVFPDTVKAREAVARMVARFTGGSWEAVLSRLDSPAAIYTQVAAEPLRDGRTDGIDHATLDEAFRDPGVVIVEQAVRYHPDGIGAHVLGYLDPSGTRGIAGVERLLDRYLAGGIPGRIAVYADAKGRPLRGLGVRWLQGEFVGGGVRLTIDRDIQALVEEVMDDSIERGAVVVMDPRTGEVLAMASRPTFRPGDIASAVGDPAAPLLNRAIMAYPPGSVFKVVVAAVAIETGAASLYDTFYDPGYVDVGATRFRCYAHEQGGHGMIDLLDATAYSCNTAFITIGLRVGAARLLDFAEQLGLGSTTGVALPGEQAGVIPEAQSLSPQDVANLAIGQGRLSMTPLQVATVMSVIANGGLLQRPRLVREVLPGKAPDRRASGLVVEPAEPVRVFSEDTCRQVASMLEAVTRRGTGTAAWVEEGGSAGKTGSAETEKEDRTDSPTSHAWFAGFAPLSEPRLVIVVFVEEGMSGGKAAAPVFARIARRALEIYRPSE
jgi:cell division protein FtsI/penicillin-binding protein 2